MQSTALWGPSGLELGGIFHWCSHLMPIHPIQGVAPLAASGIFARKMWLPAGLRMYIFRHPAGWTSYPFLSGGESVRWGVTPICRALIQWSDGFPSSNYRNTAGKPNKINAQRLSVDNGDHGIVTVWLMTSCTYCWDPNAKDAWLTWNDKPPAIKLSKNANIIIVVFVRRAVLGLTCHGAYAVW